MAIHLLQDTLISKIAAGEVIERPASIVKELIENALDAKAHAITIELERAGKERISVTDDGAGMTKEDLHLACMRHTTSKIASFDDLYALDTMGFRGEALASIAAVSDLTIITRQDDQVSGNLIRHSFGALVEEKPHAANKGTAVIVRNLFRKVPARLKFLKDDTVEMRNIMTHVTRLSLIHPDISFSVTHNGKLLLSTQRTTQDNTIATVLGTTVARDLLPVDTPQVKGYISRPSLTRNDRSQQYLCLNKRPINDKVIGDAIYDAYHTLLFLDRQPVVVLDITLDPKEFDVNVHPTKKEVRFAHPRRIYDLVFEAVKQALEDHDLTLAHRADNAQSVLGPTTQAQRPQPPSSSKTPNRYSGFSQKELRVGEPRPSWSTTPVAVMGPVAKAKEEADAAQAGLGAVDAADEPRDDFFVLGQVHKTYILCETKEGFRIYDQHATEERINYEIMIEETRKEKGQALLDPATFEVSPAELKAASEHQNALNGLGFDVEAFGTNTIIVRRVPLLLHKQMHASVVLDLLSAFSVAKNKTFEELRDLIAATAACRASIKAGDLLTRTQMIELIRRYRRCTRPYTCPHGRPAAINVSIKELEKMFKRVA